MNKNFKKIKPNSDFDNEKFNIEQEEIKLPFGKNQGGLKSVIRSELKTIVDERTGEVIISESTAQRYVETEPPYVKLYISDIMRIKEVPPGMDKVLLVIISKMSYDNVIFTYKPIKIDIANRLGKSLAYIEKSIITLIKAAILIKIDRAMYIVDPELFGRGRWKDISKLRLSIDYDPKTGEKRLSSNINKEQLKLNL